MPVRLRKAVNERGYLSKAKGGGVLRREVWIDDRDNVVRYNLAYVNPLIYPGDHGRVLGYDASHGFHHRHYKGKVTAVRFENFELVAARFQREWIELSKEVRLAKNRHSG